MTTQNETLDKTGVAMASVKALLDGLSALEGVDHRSAAVARTHFETAFLWVAVAASGEGVLT
ncbi:MAG: hypothetical protein P0Y59_02595 [Candidatus Sphingomonas phytovorans]|nr:hypothetical protein [Sphingomonas sp.]WEK00600.1 MAG: hypothetical protein P0Y59_02595 [Sphingomonas sp.]